ncbi:MAG: Fe(3+) ABC transporter substrate-binding protein [Firmicutes bacterium HGW-Firmicutes-20]|jgi:iron(III) transport system substrate-binding protein|nr:MAG: Fe(3+) ABC transporter substrate-binding protein [Firmicutes bacterium HGW-Firmicutes-20]PKM86874.1 MAG: Fe(3+) ABC transporter substrate-binding protein [Firmicutes bacterium HGW-Firmicutes-10]
MKRLFIFVAVALTVLAGCGPKPQTNRQVNVYSARNYDVDKNMFAAFEAETGIKVNLIEGKGDELLERINREKADSVADVFMTVGGEHIYFAQQNDLLQDLNTAAISKFMDENLYGKNWVAITQRARVIVYDKIRITNPTIQTYEDLIDSQYSGKLLVRSATSSYNIALLAAMIQREGIEKATAWAAGVVSNFARTPTGNDRDQSKAAVAGLGDYAIMNTYYIGTMSVSSDAEEVAVAAKLGVIYPKNTHVNISWAAIVKGSKNSAEAQLLIEYLVAKQQQTIYTRQNGEFPVRDDVAPSDLIQSWGSFEAEDIDYEQLGAYVIEAVKIFDQVKWQ